MTKINAEILCDSVSPTGDRLTTFKLTFPRFLLAELNTHRMFSKNSASSRAIPFNKMVKSVQNDPFIPIAWQKEHKGMQGSEYFIKQEDVEWNNRKWLTARDNAINSAKYLNAGFPDDKESIGVTKQLCNRLLEPFMWHTVILTATEFENFFKLRCPQYEYIGESDNMYFKSKKEFLYFEYKKNPSMWTHRQYWKDEQWLKINKGQAEIHMMELAEQMWDAMNESNPRQLSENQWHIPMIEIIED